MIRALALALLLVGLARADGPAPDVSFRTADGKTVRLSECRGKTAVVLLFMRGFKGDFACFHCGRQTRAYREGYEKLKAAGAEVWMVLPGAEDAAGYLAKVGGQDEDHPDPEFAVPFPVLLDTDCSASRAFGVPIEDASGGGFPVSHPTTVVVGKDGAIVYTYRGKNPSDRPSVDDVLAVLAGSPPAGPGPKQPGSKERPTKPTLPWVGYEEGLKAAREQRKPILLDFYADW